MHVNRVVLGEDAGSSSDGLGTVVSGIVSLFSTAGKAYHDYSQTEIASTEADTTKTLAGLRAGTPDANSSGILGQYGVPIAIGAGVLLLLGVVLMTRR